MDKKQRLLLDLQNRTALKVIAGIRNFDFDNVMKIVSGAEHMGATCVDICANEAIVTAAVAKANRTAICVSAVDVDELITAENLGADMLELGNYEAFYEDGIYFSAQQVLMLATELMTRKKSALVSVTIPGHLDVAAQVDLAVKLEELGVDMIQTEGATLVEAKSPSALGQIEKARLTLANTIELAKSLEKAFIITASAMTPDTVKLAIAAGAHGVGVGKYVNRLESEIQICAAIGELQESLSAKAQSTVLN